jgi:hypothetical protein
MMAQRVRHLAPRLAYGAFAVAFACGMCGSWSAGRSAEPKPAAAEEQRHASTAQSSPTSRSDRTIEGWRIRVDDRLLQPPSEAVGAPALRFLEARLGDIKVVVPDQQLKELQAVTIVLDLECGRLTSMQYHPSADWLKENGYSTELAKCVHLPRAADLPTRRNINEQPWVISRRAATATRCCYITASE